MEKSYHIGRVNGEQLHFKIDKSNFNKTSNYRPIICLLLAWKLLTESIYGDFDNQNLMSEEQKGYKKDSLTRDLFYIHKAVLNERKI